MTTLKDTSTQLTCSG